MERSYTEQDIRQVIDNYPVIQEREIERDLIKKAQSGDESARDWLVRCNFGFVRSYLLKHCDEEVANNYLEYFSSGLAGFNMAIDHFDLSMENKLNTYAGYWIKNRVEEAKDENSTIPKRIRENRKKIRRAQMKLLQALLREPTEEELAEETGFSLENVKEALYFGQSSLDKPISEDSDVTSGDLIQDDTIVINLDEARENRLAELDSILWNLSDRERLAVIRRYGLDGHAPQKLEEISLELGVTRERVRHILAKAERKLKIVILDRRTIVFEEEDE